MPIPQHIVHLTYNPHVALFDPRPIWTALRQAEQEGKLPAGAGTAIPMLLGDLAISIVTRHLLIKTAIGELNAALREMYALIPNPMQIPEVPGAGYRVVNEKLIEAVRNRILLHTDSTLFEFRSYLDLLSKFVYEVLKGIGRAPASSQTLASGEVVKLLGNRGEVKTHGLLLYLLDQLTLDETWYRFLQRDRNHFTHGAAPYCAIEILPGDPAPLELIITRKNVIDFASASPEDYFRISELQNIVAGVNELASQVQEYLRTDILK